MRKLEIRKALWQRQDISAAKYDKETSEEKKNLSKVCFENKVFPKTKGEEIKT